VQISAGRLETIKLLAAVCVGCACVWGAILLPQSTFAGMDFLNLIYPRALLVQQSVAAGELPLWNPYEWNGSPLLAAMQGGVLYPPAWVAYLLPLPYGQQLLLFAHLVFAGVGAGLLARRLLGAGVPAGALAAVAYGCSGFLLGRLEQVNVVCTLAWTPWLFLATHEVFSWRRSPFVFSGAVALAFMAGHPQTLFLAMLALAVFYLALWAVGRKTTWPGAGAIGNLALAGLAAGLLVAAQLLPSHELSGLSERVWPYDDPFSPALSIRHLLPSLFIPRHYNALGDTAGRPFGYSEQELYLGLTTAVLAAVGLGASLWRRAPAALAWAIIVISSLWFATGKEGGLAPLTMKVFPFLEHSRGTARMLNVTSLGLCMLAALGLEKVLAPIRNAALVGWVCVAVVIADLALTHRPELASILVSSEVLDLPRSRVASVPQLRNGSVRLYRFMQNDSNFYLDNRRAGVVQRGVRLQPNGGSAHGIAVTDGYEEGLLPTRAYANLLRRFNRNLRSGSPDAGLLAAMDAGYMLTEYPLPSKAGRWNLLQPPVAGPQLSLFQNEVELPRVLGGSQMRNTSGPLSLEALVRAYDEKGAAPGQAVSVNGFTRILRGREEVRHPLHADLVTSGESGGPFRFKSSTPNTRTYLVKEPVQGPLVAFGLNYPGWKLIAADGAAVTVKPANALFSTIGDENVTLSQGAVSFRYQPFSFRLALFISLSSLLCLGCLTLRRVRLGRRGPNQPAAVASNRSLTRAARKPELRRMDSENQRRRHNRIKTAIPAQFGILVPEATFQPKLVPAEVSDLSERGAMVLVQLDHNTYLSLLQKTRYCRVSFPAGMGLPAKIIGKAVYIHPLGKGDNAQYRLGLFFEESDITAVGELRDYIARTTGAAPEEDQDLDLAEPEAR